MDRLRDGASRDLVEVLKPTFANLLFAARFIKLDNAATAHKLAGLIYRMLKFGGEYVDIGQEKYDERYRTTVIKSLKRRARYLGYQLVANPPATNVVP